VRQLVGDTPSPQETIDFPVPARVPPIVAHVGLDVSSVHAPEAAARERLLAACDPSDVLAGDVAGADAHRRADAVEADLSDALRGG
jgi:hypothetical protein